MTADRDDSVAESTNPYVREAKFPEDFEAIVEIAHKSFLFDPVFLFWGQVAEASLYISHRRLKWLTIEALELQVTSTGLKEKDDKNLLVFLTFFLRACIAMKARFTVVVVPTGDGKETIASTAYWLPPNKRLELYHVGRLLRCGAIGLFKAWGYTGVDRITTQYLDKCHHSFVEAFRERDIKQSVNSSWYLTLAMTDPAYQGRSFMTMLVKEQFEFEPNAIYILEATTQKSMGQYGHLGFDLQTTFVLGRGKAGANGLPAKGEDAVGMEVFPMIRWPASLKK